MALYRVTFEVQGEGRFPLDMLRYDSTWPATQEDVPKLTLREFRKLTMSTHRQTKAGGPAVQRWRSFGWVVSNIQRRRH